MPRNYAVYLCGPRQCPTDPAFEHDNFYGCVPKDFSERTGRSKTHRQHRDEDGRYRWNGGCDPTESARRPLSESVRASDDSRTP